MKIPDLPELAPLVSHEGVLMVLRPPVRAYANRPAEQRVLYWDRISEVDG